MSMTSTTKGKVQCEKRTVYLICIMPQQDFEVSRKKCESNLPMDLHISIGFHVFSWAELEEHYIKQLQEILKDTNSTCDGILIYALPETETNLESLLNFFQSLHPLLKNSRLYLDLKSLITKTPTLSRTEVLKKFGIPCNMLPNVKVINAFPLSKNPQKPSENEARLTNPLPKMIGKRVRLLEDEKIFDCIVQPVLSSQSDNLSCKPWFQWYIQRDFTCLAGRLMDFSEAFHLNTAINAFILSDLGSYLLSVIMPKIYPDFKRRFSKPISGSPQIISSLFHLLYQSKCFSSIKQDKLDGLKTVFNPCFKNTGTSPFEAFKEIIEDIDNELLHNELLQTNLLSLNTFKVENSKDVMLYQSYTLRERNPVQIPVTHYAAIALLCFYRPDKVVCTVCGFLYDGQKAVLNPDENNYELIDWETEKGLEMCKNNLKSYLKVDVVDQISFNKNISYIIYLNKGISTDLQKVC